MDLLILLIALVALAIGLFDLAALRWGVDSTDGSSDPRRGPRPAGIDVR